MVRTRETGGGGDGCLRVADEEEASRREQARQGVDRPGLGGSVEVDEEVAAEDHVEVTRAGPELGGEEVAGGKAHLPLHLGARR